MSGCMAKQIHEKFPTIEIYAVNRSKQGLELAFQDGVICAGYTSISDLPKSLDLVIVGTPISVVNESLRQASSHIESSCLFTDIASVKCGIGEGVSWKPGHVFIGGHPMAGKTDTGYRHADIDLLKGALYMITTAKPPEGQVFTSFLRELDYRVLEIDPVTHDALLASASHMPFLMAALMTDLSQSAGQDARFKQIISSGFRDTTRVASGSPDWAVDISQHNKANLLQKLAELKGRASALEALIKEGDPAELRAYFADLKTYRDSLYS